MQPHVGIAPKKNRIRAATIVRTIKVGFGGGTLGLSSLTMGCAITTFYMNRGGE